MTNVYKTRFINGMSTMYNKIFLVGCFKWYLLRPWEFFKDVYREIKAFLQRGYRGYADNDIWGLDEYLSRVISESAKQLANNLNSHPVDLTEKQWKKVLLKISKDINEPYILDNSLSNMSNYNQQSKEAYKKQREALKLLVKWFNDLWD